MILLPETRHRSAKNGNPTPFRPANHPAWSTLGALLIAAASTTFAAEPVRTHALEVSALVRLGNDSNPTATHGPIANSSAIDDSFVYAAGVGVNLTLSAPSPAKSALKLSYAGEAVRYDTYSQENYSAHRFAWSGQCSDGPWKFTADGSSLYVAGSTETLPADSAENANGVALWREHRRQWQHRLKLQAQADYDTYLVRTTGTLLAYDFLTQAVAGRVPFADRSDMQAAADLGWKQNPRSVWLTGARIGHQEQAIVPLPNCEFDYSNNYTRLVASWEGKPFSNATVSFAAGPDFRRYTGAIDPRIFLGGRNRTSLWFEGSFALKPCPSLTLTGKAARMDWLSSTGKSAYVDTNLETAAGWTVNPHWILRLTAKLHGCDYFPVVRNDWETLFGTGATFKYSERAQFTVDLMDHRGWNNLAVAIGREFQRQVLTFGAVFRF